MGTQALLFLAFFPFFSYDTYMRAVWHSLIILFSFAIAFLWEISIFSDSTIQLLAGLVFVYVMVGIIKRKRHPEKLVFGGIFDIFVLNTAILLLIFATGQMSSPLFFLLYFLGFGITFIFEPVTVFVFVICAIALFIPQALQTNSIEQYVLLGSLLLISPLAFFFGQEYKDRDQQEEEIEEMTERTKDAADTIAQDVEQVLKKEKANLKSEDVEKLSEILEESQELREESNQN
ncbi:MAG: hypothetical protein ACREGI_05460 [Candidatus Levyibacteriota bacterium]